MAGYPKIIHTEEGMRDGLQIESADIPVESKIRLLNALSETGLKEINVGSFVSPKYTPQMAKVDELVSKFTPKPGVKYTYTALNDKGVEATSFNDWRTIEQAEEAQARPGSPREKFVRPDEWMKVLGRRG